MCGRRAIQRKKLTVRYEDGVEVPNVLAEVCSACGEIYFDIRAMEQMEAQDRRLDRKPRKLKPAAGTRKPVR